MKSNEKWNTVDRFSIEKRIWSVEKEFSPYQCSFVHRFQWQNIRLIKLDFSRILIGRKMSLRKIILMEKIDLLPVSKVK